MNTKEFAERCNVSPQIVRLWIRSGKLVRTGGGLTLADGFVLLPKAGIRKRKDRCERTLLVRTEAGVSRRTIINWLRTGKVVKDEYGALYVNDGLELQMCYRPVRRKEVSKADRIWK